METLLYLKKPLLTVKCHRLPQNTSKEIGGGVKRKLEAYATYASAEQNERIVILMARMPKNL